jgi:hypothetical protein
MLISIGVEILEVAQRMYLYGIPKSVKIKVTDEFVLEMPDLRYEAHHGVWATRPTPSPDSSHEIWFSGGNPTILNRMISSSIPDPIYMQSLAPYRFRRVSAKYSKLRGSTLISRN